LSDSVSFSADRISGVISRIAIRIITSFFMFFLVLYCLKLFLVMFK
jgi:hypothetical protein